MKARTMEVLAVANYLLSAAVLLTCMVLLLRMV